MYSVVLLMALSGSGDAPALGGGCGGCGGLFGKSCKGCDGGCNGCDSGCCGNKLFGGGKLFGGKGCGGCDGGCSGSCNGCSGHKSHKSCNGCDGGCNGCNGGGLFRKLKDKMGGCNGCDGGCHGNSCNGGCHGCVSTVAPAMPKADASAPATIVVALPAEAKLLIDGNSTTSTSERRVFVSPTLEAGQEYFYTLKIEHKGEVKEERVAVTAGQEVNVKVEFASSVASK